MLKSFSKETSACNKSNRFFLMMRFTQIQIILSFEMLRNMAVL